MQARLHTPACQRRHLRCPCSGPCCPTPVHQQEGDRRPRPARRYPLRSLIACCAVQSVALTGRVVGVRAGRASSSPANGGQRNQTIPATRTRSGATQRARDMADSYAWTHTGKASISLLLSLQLGRWLSTSALLVDWAVACAAMRKSEPRRDSSTSGVQGGGLLHAHHGLVCCTITTRAASDLPQVACSSSRLLQFPLVPRTSYPDRLTLLNPSPS